MAKRTKIIVAALVLAGSAELVWYRLHPAPIAERVLLREALPDWQTRRTRVGAAAGGDAAKRMVGAAKKWPAIAQELSHLDDVWPDDKAVHASVKSLNKLLEESHLAYWLDVQDAGGKPIVLTYELEAHVPWRAGAKTVDVLRVRRLDRLNIELGFLGETSNEQPVVYLDRIEAQMIHDTMPAAWDAWDSPAGTTKTPKPPVNEVEHAAAVQLRRVAEEKAPEIAKMAEKMAIRDVLLETMRARLHEGNVWLNPPERLVFGDEWFETMWPETRLTRPGGPLILDTDLRAVKDADEALRAPELTSAFAVLLELQAASTEAHEAHHALESEDQTPPALLLDDLANDPRFAVLAERELRAYLGELHDTPSSPCLVVAEMVRGVFGQHRSATPHFFARRVILKLLADEKEVAPVELLGALCKLPDDELRHKAAEARRKLYGVENVDAARVKQ